MFKAVFKIFITLFALLMATLAGFSLYYTFYGKKIVEDAAGKYLQQKVTIDRLIVSFPLSAHVENIMIGQIRVRSIDIIINPLYLLKNKVVIERLSIKEPDLLLRRDAQGWFLNEIQISKLPPKKAVPASGEIEAGLEPVSTGEKKDTVITLPSLSVEIGQSSPQPQNIVNPPDGAVVVPVPEPVVALSTEQPAQQPAETVPSSEVLPTAQPESASVPVVGASVPKDTTEQAGIVPAIKVPDDVTKVTTPESPVAVPAEQTNVLQDIPVLQPPAADASFFVVSIRHLSVEKGEIVFKDLRTQSPLLMTLSEFDLTIKDIDPDFAQDMTIKAASYLRYLETTVPDALQIEGKLNLKARSFHMDVVLDGMEYSYFKEYYPKYWKPEKLGIKQAVLRLHSTLYTENNKLVVQSALSLKDLKFDDSEDSQKYEKVSKMISSIVSAFKGESQQYPTFEFKVSTDLDNPQFNLDEIYRQFNRKARIPVGPVAKVVTVVAGAVKNTVDLGKGVFNKSVSLFTR